MINCSNLLVDALGMPEPTLTIEPPLQEGDAYMDGQKVNITCKANGDNVKDVNVDIVAGEHVVRFDIIYVRAK